jgi:hypothetical protein
VRAILLTAQPRFRFKNDTITIEKTLSINRAAGASELAIVNSNRFSTATYEPPVHPVSKPISPCEQFFDLEAIAPAKCRQIQLNRIKPKRQYTITGLF